MGMSKVQHTLVVGQAYHSHSQYMHYRLLIIRFKYNDLMSQGCTQAKCHNMLLSSVFHCVLTNKSNLVVFHLIATCSSIFFMSFYRVSQNTVTQKTDDIGVDHILWWLTAAWSWATCSSRSLFFCLSSSTSFFRASASRLSGGPPWRCCFTNLKVD